jgi:hypothetical protein
VSIIKSYYDYLIKYNLTHQETKNPIGLRSYPPHYLRTLPTSKADTYIRLANFTPTFPPIDVYLDGRLFGSNLAFTDITDYVETTPGQHLLTVYPANQRTNPLFVTTLILPVADVISTFAFGFEDINFLLVSDDFRVLPDEVAVKFVHLSPNAPPLDLYVNDNKIFTSVNFTDSTRYMVLKEEPSYDIELKIPGTDVTLLEVPNMTFRTNNTYTFNAIGLYEGTPPLQIVTTLDGSTY